MYARDIAAEMGSGRSEQRLVELYGSSTTSEIGWRGLLESRRTNA